MTIEHELEHKIEDVKAALKMPGRFDFAKTATAAFYAVLETSVEQNIGANAVVIAWFRVIKTIIESRDGVTEAQTANTVFACLSEVFSPSVFASVFKNWEVRPKNRVLH